MIIPRHAPHPESCPETLRPTNSQLMVSDIYFCCISPLFIEVHAKLRYYLICWLDMLSEKRHASRLCGLVNFENRPCAWFHRLCPGAASGICRRPNTRNTTEIRLPHIDTQRVHRAERRGEYRNWTAWEQHESVQTSPTVLRAQNLTDVLKHIMNSIWKASKQLTDHVIDGLWNQ